MGDAHPLSGLLTTLGFSGDRFARRLNAAAESLGRPERIHPKTPYKWMRGEIPRPPWRSLAAHVLSRELGRAIAVTDLGWPSDEMEYVSAIAGLHLTWMTCGTLQVVQTVTDASPMDRRTFLLLAGSSLTAPAHEWLIAHPAEQIGRRSGSKIPLDVVDHLDEMTGHLRLMDDRVGGGNLLDLVLHHLRYVSTLLNEGRYTDTVGRRLHATAGELLRLSGFLAFDADQHARAQRYWIASLHAAHTAGDRALGANILGFMSCQAKDLNHNREAVVLADTARTGYPGTSPKVKAILSLRLAEAHANDRTTTPARRDTDTRRSIDEAFDALTDTAPTTSDPAWSYWMTPAHAHGQAGYCHLRTGDHTRARHHLRQSLQGLDYSREDALRNTLLATTYIRQPHPDLEKALAHANQSLTLLQGQVDSARCRGHLSQLTTALTPYRASQPVANFLDRASSVLTAERPRPAHR